MLWVNHTRGLRAVGGSRREFYRVIRGELSRFAGRLRAEAAAGLLARPVSRTPTFASPAEPGS